jgi:hypothetical protein
MRLGAALAASVASEEPALVALAAHEQSPAKADGVNAPSPLLHPDHLFGQPTPFLVFRLVSERSRPGTVYNQHA